MASGEVVIQSMWSPAVTAVRTRGIDCVFQPLKEGYRGWGYTMGAMKHLTGLKLDCFYEYLNWYCSGFPGAFIAREGYYSAQPENARKFLTDGRMGLLVRRQAGGDRHRRSVRQAGGKGRPDARRRQLRPAHGQHRGVELGDGRRPLPDAEMERIHHVLTTESSMKLGVFIPIGNNGWLISTTSPQYKPSFDLNNADRPEGGRLWLRLRAVDDQAARLRRPVGVLGLQPGILHADGGPGRARPARSSFSPPARC